MSPAGETKAPEPAPAGAPTEADEAQASAAATRTAGRGGLAIAVAKLSFILFGFAQQLVLPRVLGVDGYGEISRVLAIVGIVNNVVVSASIQGVSRSVASVPESKASEALRRTLWVHAPLALGISTLFAAGAGLIADAVHASHVTGPLRIVGAVVLLYGLYAPLVGGLNGRRKFVAQASLDIFYGGVRTVGLTVGAWAMGVTGAALGFVGAAALILVPASVAAGFGKRGEAGPSVREYLSFLGPLAVGQIFLNLLMQTDFMLLSRFVGQAAAAAGEPTSAADRLVGVYRGVQLFAFLPFQMLMSITFVLFPMLARAFAEADVAAVARYTKTGVRLALVLTGLMSGAVSSLGPSVLRFAFPSEIADSGGMALRILSLGMGAFAILGIEMAALTSLRQERLAAALTAGTVVAVAVGCWLVVPTATFGPAMVVASALATSGALTLAAVVGALAVKSAAGAFVAPASLVRVFAAMAATIAVGWKMPWLGKVAVLGEVGVVAVVYVVVLVVTGELGRADVATVQTALGRKKQPSS